MERFLEYFEENTKPEEILYHITRGEYKRTIYRTKYGGSKFESDSISYVMPEVKKEIMELPKKYDRVIMVKHEPNKITFKIDGKPIATFPAYDKPKIGLHPVDSKNGYVHVGHEISNGSFIK